MLAAVLKGVHQIGLQEVPKPVLLRDSDVVLKVTAATICTSEVHFWEGFLPPCPPFIIGHEFVGIVEETGNAVKALKSGDRVAVPCYPYCGICNNCRKGLTAWCTNGALLGSGESFGGLSGGLAEFVRVPHADSALVKIPDQISDEQAIFVGDMLATGHYAVSNCNLRPGDTVAVFGAGPAGLCAVHLARLYSPSKIILVGRKSNRLQAGLKMGATHIIDEAEQDPVAQIMALTNGQGVNAAIEAVGVAATVNTAAQALKMAGILSIVGFFPPGNIDFPMHTLLFKNATIKVGMSAQDNLQMLIDLVAEGKIDTTPLITHRMPFKEFDKAFTIFAEKRENVIKIILKP